VLDKAALFDIIFTHRRREQPTWLVFLPHAVPTMLKPNFFFLIISFTRMIGAQVTEAAVVTAEAGRTAGAAGTAGAAKLKLFCTDNYQLYTR
jgi:hypothetical protein